jgi:general stress protein 26
MLDLSLPSEVTSVFETFRCCEFTTLTKQGVPITWPVSAVYFPERGQFLITTSISFPQKVWNIRRNPKVALLFSDPTGSGMTNPPIVLVQGNAAVSDEIVVLNEDMERFWKELYRRQPFSRNYSSNALSRKLMSWYFMRWCIFITPQTIHWYPQGDMQQASQSIEVTNAAS